MLEETRMPTRSRKILVVDDDEPSPLSPSWRDVRDDLRDLRTQQREDTQHLNTRIDEFGQYMTEQIDAHGAKVEAAMSSGFDKMTVVMDRGFEKVTADVEGVKVRVSALENWRWLIFGGACVVSFLVVDVIARFLYSPFGTAFIHWLKAF